VRAEPGNLSCRAVRFLGGDQGGFGDASKIRATVRFVHDSVIEMGSHNVARTSRVSRGLLGIVALVGAALLGAAACSSDPAAGPPNPSGKVAGAQCVDGTECQSLACDDGVCTPVTSEQKTAGPDDGLKNADETDVDCGGAKAPKCAVGKACTKNEDCASDACSYAKKCVEFKSCTGHFGGDTCGEGETGEAGAKHESCCTIVSDPKSGIRLGKYLVTAGRMRAFIERYKGDLQSWAATKPKGWKDEWTETLPASMDDALFVLGPGEKRGCNIVNQGGRTYWQPAIDGDERELSDFSQDVLDEKALNCVTWSAAQALCHFDGGRLATSEEIRAQITNHGATKWPWGNTPNFVEKAALDQLVHEYSYNTPDPPATMRMVKSGTSSYPLDHAFFVAPPGRRPLGANQIGVEDAMGNLLPWVDDAPNRFTWTASWEEHGILSDTTREETSTWPPPNTRGGEENGYYGIGARCAFE
jgi:hypothetical protein